MNSAVIQLLVLAGVAIFLILRLKSVLGTREGFEKPPLSVNNKPNARDRDRPEFDVIEGGPDHDIVDNVPEGSDAASALAEMKKIDRDFNVTEFLQGARSAYEMILMAFEKGDLSDVEGLLAEDVRESFAGVIAERERQGLTVEATFMGVRDVTLQEATFNQSTEEAELTVRFTGELTWEVRDANGTVVDGDRNETRRQRDVWTFARVMGTDDPNWSLVATGE